MRARPGIFGHGNNVQLVVWEDVRPGVTVVIDPAETMSSMYGICLHGDVRARHVPEQDMLPEDTITFFY